MWGYVPVFQFHENHEIKGFHILTKLSTIETKIRGKLFIYVNITHSAAELQRKK
jgi:hypothetical protein